MPFLSPGAGPGRTLAGVLRLSGLLRRFGSDRRPSLLSVFFLDGVVSAQVAALGAGPRRLAARVGGSRRRLAFHAARRSPAAADGAAAPLFLLPLCISRSLGHGETNCTNTMQRHRGVLTTRGPRTRRTPRRRAFSAALRLRPVLRLGQALQVFCYTAESSWPPPDRSALQTSEHVGLARVVRFLGVQSAGLGGGCARSVAARCHPLLQKQTHLSNTCRTHGVAVLR